ncbi:AAA family ATPase [Brachybacterium sp. UMB0905]|uniref:AAA family ATPase n=1 Tax=Brachybacterium sp. UMB0905 TaxID=2069310 RepID=UPI000C800CEC|nr:hypothetical protein CJ197_14760 [Brachybacterium sp. UMB0905]
MSAKILILSGASGAGKSTLARHLLSQARTSWVHLEADRSAPEIVNPPGAAAFDQSDYLDALLNSLLVWPHSGYNSIIDGILPYPEDDLFRRCAATLRAHNARFVNVYAPPETVKHRIEKRGWGDPGWSLRQLEDINTTEPPDYSVDTSTALDANTGVKSLLAWMNERSPDA